MARSLLMAGLVLAVMLLGLACAGSGGKAPAVARVDPPSRAATQPANCAGVHNVVAYTDTIYSGSVPEGADGFRTLAGMGIKTIISVDGATPDVEAAKQYGIRYVHLPIGYDGISKERTLEIARAVNDLPGPVYIHCHHGKHRSAAAAAAAAVTLGKLSVEQALAEMKVSGTAANYTGLFECVKVATVASNADLANASNAFPEKTQIGDFAQVMVHVDEAIEHLRDIEKAGWKTPSSHPDLVPAAEAGRLADLFRNAPQPKAQARTPEFAAWMTAAANHASELEQSLLSATASSDQRSANMKLISQSCSQCHAKYRD